MVNRIFAFSVLVLVFTGTLCWGESTEIESCSTRYVKRSVDLSYLVDSCLQSGRYNGYDETFTCTLKIRNEFTDVLQILPPIDGSKRFDGTYVIWDLSVLVYPERGYEEGVEGALKEETFSLLVKSSCP